MPPDTRITRKPRGYELADLNDQESEPLSSAPVEYRRHPVYSRTEWLYETGTLILSAGLLAGIICIFIKMKDKPLSNWTASITLTATISTLTTFCSAALMHSVSQFIGQLKWIHFKDGSHKLSHFEVFDEASRGPWGSILLLTGVKWNLATIGAVITICRLSFAPLAQQVIEIKLENVPTNDSSVTYNYSHTFQRPMVGSTTTMIAGTVPQDPEMQAAILQGLYGINSFAQFECPGVCQWPTPYISLGFKTSCQNVTQATLQTQSCNGTSPKICNMTTPGGVGLTTRLMFTSWGTTYAMNVTSGIRAQATRPPTEPEPSRVFPQIAQFAVYRATADHNYEPTLINVTECALDLTAFEFADARANGSTGFSFRETTEIDVVAENGGENPWDLGGGAEIPVQIQYTNASTTANGVSIPAFEIGWAEVVALGNFLTSDIVVSEFITGDPPEHVNRGLAPFIGGDVDVAERFERMATAMTDRVRNGPNAQLARGQRIDSVQYVRIQWEYLIGPVAIELVAIIFAVLTMFKSRENRGVPLWKTSALAVLACKHDREADLIRSTIRDIKEMDEVADNSKVRLQ
ncbi:hypothetical protein BJX62DRAFT_226069 [Aspergillus germanicus]